MSFCTSTSNFVKIGLWMVDYRHMLAQYRRRRPSSFRPALLVVVWIPSQILYFASYKGRGKNCWLRGGFLPSLNEAVKIPSQTMSGSGRSIVHTLLAVFYDEHLSTKLYCNYYIISVLKFVPAFTIHASSQEVLTCYLSNTNHANLLPVRVYATSTSMRCSQNVRARVTEI